MVLMYVDVSSIYNYQLLAMICYHSGFVSPSFIPGLKCYMLLTCECPKTNKPWSLCRCWCRLNLSPERGGGNSISVGYVCLSVHITQTMHGIWMIFSHKGGVKPWLGPLVKDGLGPDLDHESRIVVVILSTNHRRGFVCSQALLSLLKQL